MYNIRTKKPIYRWQAPQAVKFVVVRCYGSFEAAVAVFDDYLVATGDIIQRRRTEPADRKYRITIQPL